jgi:hypothetical protein
MQEVRVFKDLIQSIECSHIGVCTASAQVIYPKSLDNRIAIPSLCPETSPEEEQGRGRFPFSFADCDETPNVT